MTIQVQHIDFKTKVMEIKLMDAYISKWEAPELNAGASDGAVEKITLIPHQILIEDGESSVSAVYSPNAVGEDMGSPPPKPSIYTNLK